MECNLDLRLSQPPDSAGGESPRRYFNPQKLTIFYNGRICVCDVTEIQARAIIWQASKVEQGRCTDSERRIGPNLNANNSAELPICTAVSCSSMKKSLQSFLLKRKSRRVATSPYGNVKR